MKAGYAINFICLLVASRQKEVMTSLYAIKAGEKRFREALAAGRDLLERRAQGIILGCTEFNLVRHFLANDLPVIDPIEVLAQACVEVARGAREVVKGEFIMRNDSSV